MKIAIGSDESNNLTNFVIENIRSRGIEVVLIGPLCGKNIEWVDVAEEVAKQVSDHIVDQGMLFCWTGTGVTLVSNKVHNVRAALCNDGETARGARAWNDANLLCISLRSTSEAVASEIIESWLSTDCDPDEEYNIQKVKDLDEKYRSPSMKKKGV